MMGAELALAVLETIGTCINLGKQIIAKCSAFRNAEAQIHERITRFRSCIWKTTQQAEFLRRVAHTLDENHLQMHKQQFEILVGKLKNASTILDFVLESWAQESEPQQPSRSKRAIYAVFRKQRIDKAIEDIEVWQRIADPSWFLIMRMASGEIDRQLRATNMPANIPSTQIIRDGIKATELSTVSVFRAESELLSARQEPIPFCESKVAYRQGSSKPLILDTVPCPLEARSTMEKIMTKDVRDLARKLRHKEPDAFGLLTCKGVVRSIDAPTGRATSFTYVFGLPESFSGPMSLRARLLSPVGEPSSLSHRFRLAMDVAKAVSYVHTFGFVHKDIRPETILCLLRPPPPGNDDTAATDATVTADGGLAAFLVGFQNVRSADGRTHRRGDTDWHKNLYRHKRRRGALPEDDYIMQHDIYALGVCLLEIGLWKSFIRYESDTTGEKEELVPSDALGLTRADVDSLEEAGLEEHLVFLSQTELPRRMGNKYASIVETCLTCLDPGNSDFGDESEFEDEDGIQVGVRYIEKVLFNLNNILV